MRDAGQKEYARTSDDVHANFKRVGKHLGLAPEKVIMVYLLKHIDGITAHIDGHKSQREDVEGRIIDAIVYLFLLIGLITADKSNESINNDKEESDWGFGWTMSCTPGVDFEDKDETN